MLAKRQADVRSKRNDLMLYFRQLQAQQYTLLQALVLSCVIFYAILKLDHGPQVMSSVRAEQGVNIIGQLPLLPLV